MQEHTKIIISMEEIAKEAKEIRDDFFNYAVAHDLEKAKKLQTFVQDFASDTKLTEKLVENLKFKLATAKLSDLTSKEIEAVITTNDKNAASETYAEMMHGFNMPARDTFNSWSFEKFLNTAVRPRIGLVVCSELEANFSIYIKEIKPVSSSSYQYKFIYKIIPTRSRVVDPNILSTYTDYDNAYDRKPAQDVKVTVPEADPESGNILTDIFKDFGLFDSPKEEK